MPDVTPTVLVVLFSGAVLTGGASTRMGSDKALVEIDGVPMAMCVANALRNAGATAVARVGGATGDVADAFPGEGPLGGIITALRWAGDAVVVTAPCDMPWIAAAHVTALVQALAAADELDVARSSQHLFAAWRVRGLPVLEAAFDAGERAPRRALAKLHTVVVELADGPWSADVDTPDDLTTPR